MPEPKVPILILGGTAEARKLAFRLAADPRLDVISSLAGRTSSPQTLPGKVRMGGFGGAEGLANFLRDNGIALVVDATHPFATQISANAYAAAKNTGSERVALVRPPWVKKSEPDWFDTDSLESAARIPPTGSTVFLALGSQHLEPFVFRKDVNFIVRMVDEPEIPPFPNCRVVTGMPGETIAEERALLKRESVDHLICRNSGGDAGFAKIEAAWQLGIPVLMIERPPPPAEPVLKTVDEVVDFIERGFGAYPS